MSQPNPPPDPTPLLQATDVKDGYVVVLGIGTGRLAEEFVRQSKCDVMAVDADANKVAGIRQRFCARGLYGARVSIYVGDPAPYPFPPYLASLVVSEDPSAVCDSIDRSIIERVFRSLRPYGGTACVAISPEKREALAEEYHLPGGPGTDSTEDVDVQRIIPPMPEVL